MSSVFKQIGDALTTAYKNVGRNIDRAGESVTSFAYRNRNTIGTYGGAVLSVVPVVGPYLGATVQVGAKTYNVLQDTRKANTVVRRANQAAVKAGSRVASSSMENLPQVSEPQLVTIYPGEQTGVSEQKPYLKGPSFGAVITSGKTPYLILSIVAVLLALNHHVTTLKRG